MSRFAFAIWLTACLAACGGPQARSRSEVHGPAGCGSVPQAVSQQLGRLLAAAAEHASVSRVCADGDGERRAVEVTRTCADGTTVRIAYRVTTEDLHGGECSPYPSCAASRTETSDHELVVTYTGGRAPLPARIPGLDQLRGQPATPLDHEHSGGCFGTKPPFTETLVDP